MQPEECLDYFFQLCAPQGSPANPLSQQAGERFAAFLRAHGVAAYLYLRVAALGLGGLLPPETLKSLEKACLANTALNLAAAGQLGEILKALGGQGIDVMLMKGSSLAFRVYPHPAERSMVDLDLLVREADVRGATRTLQGLGYEMNSQPWESPGHHLPPMRKPGAPYPLEIHWRLLAPGRVRGLEPGMVWKNATRVSLAGQTCFEPAPTHSLLLVCQHTSAHLFTNGIKAICDVDAIIRTQGQELDWAGFLELAGTAVDARGVMLALHLAHTSLGTPLPTAVLQKLAENPPPAEILAGARAGMAGGREFPDDLPSGMINTARWWFGKARKMAGAARLDLKDGEKVSAAAGARNMANRLAYVLSSNLGAALQLGRRRMPVEAAGQRHLRRWLGMR